MKKLWFSLLIGIITLIGINVHWQWLSELFDTLDSNITFWYTTNQTISIKEITDQKIVIESPIIINNTQNITKYTIMYSEYSLAEMLEKNDLLNQIKEKAFTLSWTQNPFTMELSLSDNIDPTKKYYLFIVPKDQNNNLWEVSNEIRFRLSDKTYGNAWSNQSLNQTHNAAGADMSLANITHTINGNTITLKWITIAWSTSIDLSVMTPGSTSFNRVATINMGDERYSFVANRNGEYIFQFTPNNNGRQVNYTVQMNSISNPQPPTTPWTTPPTAQNITVVPKTWPKENAIIIVIMGFLWYIFYKKLYRKAK